MASRKGRDRHRGHKFWAKRETGPAERQEQVVLGRVAAERGWTTAEAPVKAGDDQELDDLGGEAA